MNKIQKPTEINKIKNQLEIHERVIQSEKFVSETKSNEGGFMPESWQKIKLSRPLVDSTTEFPQQAK